MNPDRRMADILKRRRDAENQHPLNEMEDTNRQRSVWYRNASEIYRRCETSRGERPLGRGTDVLQTLGEKGQHHG
jgi:hypothetical protein